MTAASPPPQLSGGQIKLRPSGVRTQNHSLVSHHDSLTMSRVSASCSGKPLVWAPSGHSSKLAHDGSHETSSNRLAGGFGYGRSFRIPVPFAMPVRYPELMSNDPTLVHSQVMRQTVDKGIRVDGGGSSGTLGGSEDVLHMGIDRGLLGMSLKRHSLATRMSHHSTYPGIGPRGPTDAQPPTAPTRVSDFSWVDADPVSQEYLRRYRS